ncbi:hypothetical protein SAMN05421770_10734 [Granulicella rosea]|uniref:Uncharacterized protein n=1 Tax=Granulicella rosea TaxID=474952 RepID=A0A239LGW3_9BACT|nr:BrnT family toxin [Granulicella rosea]SNT29897.1 hypothetical protein SAMN05421770_10734 [Granulicella rosea]
MYVWDEKKRLANLAKHRLDFADAYVVYENPEKITVVTNRNEEQRYADVAVIQVVQTYLTLVYVERGADVRIISFRNASRKERRRYLDARK